VKELNGPRGCSFLILLIRSPADDLQIRRCTAGRCGVLRVRSTTADNLMRSCPDGKRPGRSPHQNKMHVCQHMMLMSCNTIVALNDSRPRSQRDAER
jgi:hypothetical protein